MRSIYLPLVLVIAAGCGSEHADPTELFEEAYDENAAGKTDTSRCSGVVAPDQGGFNKRIALTFDDGPNPNTTPDVMATLRRHGAPATFFINGERVSSNTTRALVAEMVSDPFFGLANHTWAHPNMRRLSREAAEVQIDRNTEVIRAAGGEPRYMRFPFGAASCALTDMIEERGYINTGWNIDSADWCYAGRNRYCRESTFGPVPDDVRDNMIEWVMRQARDKGGGIILFHDIHAFTRDQLDGLITTLKSEGFTFTSLDDVDAFPLLNGERPVNAFIGDACESDSDCSFDDGFCMPSDEVAGGYCTRACTTSCPDRAGYPLTRCVAAPDGTGATQNLCLIECADGSCRDGLECQALQSPAGDRDVCWSAE